MKIKTIFLDLDDVLNDFTMAALQEVGCPVKYYQYEKYNPKWGFDIVEAANILNPEPGFTVPSFWGSLSQRFWATIPVSKEFDLLLEQCEKLVGREQICILTNPVQQWIPRVAAAKMEWINRYLPTWLHKQFLIGPPKHFCARPDALLVDDSDTNVEVFCANGGQAILVPRPWNVLHPFNTKKHLLDIFRWLIEEKAK